MTPATPTDTLKSVESRIEALERRIRELETRSNRWKETIGRMRRTINYSRHLVRPSRICLCEPPSARNHRLWAFLRSFERNSSENREYGSVDRSTLAV